MIDKANITEEQIEMAYQYLKEYCDKNSQDLVKFVSDKSNIDKASEYINKQLKLPLRLVFRPNLIAKIIKDNHEWIIQKAKEKHK